MNVLDETLTFVKNLKKVSQSWSHNLKFTTLFASSIQHAVINHCSMRHKTPWHSKNTTPPSLFTRSTFRDRRGKGVSGPRVESVANRSALSVFALPICHGRARLAGMPSHTEPGSVHPLIRHFGGWPDFALALTDETPVHKAPLSPGRRLVYASLSPPLMHCRWIHKRLLCK